MKQYQRITTIISLFLVFMILTTGCLTLLQPPQSPPTDAANAEEYGKYDITRDDVLGVKDVISTDVTVFGAGLGSSLTDVVARVGKPDLQQSPRPGVVNIEYRERFNLTRIGLLFHFENDTVTRITVKQPFNGYLRGETVINHTKEDLYRMFGKPDKMQLLSTLTVYSYYDQGIDAIMDGPQMNGFSMTYPQPEKARENIVTE